MLEDLQKTTSKIKVNVKVIGDYLTSTTADFDHTDDFYDFIDGQEPALKYDVEKAAIKSIAALYDMDYMASSKSTSTTTLIVASKT